jgi:hypothetical protein
VSAWSVDDLKKRPDFITLETLIQWWFVVAGEVTLKRLGGKDPNGPVRSS